MAIVDGPTSFFILSPILAAIIFIIQCSFFDPKPSSTLEKLKLSWSHKPFTNFTGWDGKTISCWNGEWFAVKRVRPHNALFHPICDQKPSPAVWPHKISTSPLHPHRSIFTACLQIIRVLPDPAGAPSRTCSWTGFFLIDGRTLLLW